MKRAVPFYERFPTVNALAEAPLAEDIRVWEDRELYRRVVSLYRTARRLVRELGGGIPSDPEESVKLPGIGPYTAGAVACFAFERDVVSWRGQRSQPDSVSLALVVPEATDHPSRRDLTARGAPRVPANGFQTSPRISESPLPACLRGRRSARRSLVEVFIAEQFFVGHHPHLLRDG